MELAANQLALMSDDLGLSGQPDIIARALFM